MKPGTLVAYVSSREAYLGRLDQPVKVDDRRFWSVEWLDGYHDADVQTYPESRLLKVVPQ